MKSVFPQWMNLQVVRQDLVLYSLSTCIPLGPAIPTLEREDDKINHIKTCPIRESHFLVKNGRACFATKRCDQNRLFHSGRVQAQIPFRAEDVLERMTKGRKRSVFESNVRDVFESCVLDSHVHPGHRFRSRKEFDCRTTVCSHTVRFVSFKPFLSMHKPFSFIAPWPVL